MDSLLMPIMNQRLTGVDFIEDYLSLSFSGGDGMCIYNRFASVPADVNELIGSRVSGIEETEAELIIRFGARNSIRVGLSDSDYQSYPEAIYFETKEGDITVWN